MIKRKARERYFGSVVLNQPNAFESEKYKHIASVALYGSKKGNRVISVCSSGMNIGKTSVMVNMAVVFAQQGYKVLLVDGDLRMPSCEGFWNIQPGGLGLVDIVMDGVSVEDCIIQPVPSFDNLHMLPCGTKPKIPSIIFAQNEFPALVEKLKGMYDIILFDAPPLSFASELMDILKVSTEVIIVTRAGITQRDYFLDLIQTLQTADIKITGVCLNAYIDQRRGKKGSYGYGYEYYSGKNGDSDDLTSIVSHVGLLTSRRTYYRRRYEKDMKYRGKRASGPKLPRIYPYLKEDEQNT